MVRPLSFDGFVKSAFFLNMDPMMPTLQDMLAFLDQVAPPDLAESWDNPGLQVGDLSQRIQRVSVALDPTLDSVRASLEQGATPAHPSSTYL